MSKITHLRWIPKSECTLGVSGRAKLVDDYNELDRNHNNKNMQALADEIIQLAVRRNHYISKEDLVKMYVKHTGVEE